MWILPFMESHFIQTWTFRRSVKWFHQIRIWTLYIWRSRDRIGSSSLLLCISLTTQQRFTFFYSFQAQYQVGHCLSVASIIMSCRLRSSWRYSLSMSVNSLGFFGVDLWGTQTPFSTDSEIIFIDICGPFSKSPICMEFAARIIEAFSSFCCCNHLYQIEVPWFLTF